jgi:hypothetical protein
MAGILSEIRTAREYFGIVRLCFTNTWLCLCQSCHNTQLCDFELLGELASSVADPVDVDQDV